MKKYTVVIGLSIAALLWGTGAMADHPTKWDHGRGHHGSKGYHGSKAHHGSNMIDAGEKLRYQGHQEIRAGQDLIRAGNKVEGRALIRQGTEDIQAGNRLIREGKTYIYNVHEHD